MTGDETRRLEGALRDLIVEAAAGGPVAVATSGGVDSAVVLAAAARTLGPASVTAVTARSPAVPDEEVSVAASTAAGLDVRHVVVETREGDAEGYRRNAGDRCFHCKTELYGRVAAAVAEGTALFDGTNADDLGEHRPGRLAAERAGVRSPLAEARFSKSDVRTLARLWDLDVAEKPAQPCLASRIAYGVEVTPLRLDRVERAERYLRRRFELSVLRVRTDAGERARLELTADAIPRLSDGPSFAEIDRELRSYGFAAVSIDPAGFRSGSLNDALPVAELAVPQRRTAGTSKTR